MMRKTMIIAIVGLMATFVAPTVTASPPNGPNYCWCDALPSNEIGCHEDTLFTNDGQDGDVNQGATYKTCVVYSNDEQVCVFYAEQHYWHYTDYDRNGEWEQVADETEQTQGDCVPLP